ncbi:MAG: c-type cytochrome biogenesis protein CcmI, partial [Paracoccaceae bacterium]
MPRETHYMQHKEAGIGDKLMAGWQFWLAAGGMVTAVAVVLLRALQRPAAPPVTDASTLAVYRDQLAEIERDLARGAVQETEAERIRLEVQRRLLLADKTAQAVAAPSPHTQSAVIATVILATLAGGIGTYVWLGAPGYPDLPLNARIAAAEDRRANRPDQASAEALVSLPAPTP